MCVHYVFQVKYKEMRSSSKTFAQYWVICERWWILATVYRFLRTLHPLNLFLIVQHACFFNCFCLSICFLLLESECLKIIRRIRFYSDQRGTALWSVMAVCGGSTSGPKECSSSEHQQIKLGHWETEKCLLIINMRLPSAEVLSEEVCLVSEDKERRWTTFQEQKQEVPLRAGQMCRNSQWRTKKWNESLLKISDSNKTAFTVFCFWLLFAVPFRVSSHVTCVFPRLLSSLCN